MFDSNAKISIGRVRFWKSKMKPQLLFLCTIRSDVHDQSSDPIIETLHMLNDIEIVERLVRLRAATVALAAVVMPDEVIAVTLGDSSHRDVCSAIRNNIFVDRLRTL